MISGMNLRLFLSTFLMIFLAELGDKTQLSVIGRVTDPATKWTVFIAASLALVCSTLIAVQFGGLLARHLDPRAIKIGAGILFLTIGSLVLLEGLRLGKVSTATTTEPVGAIGRLVLAQAAKFERAAARDYQALAAKSANRELRDALLALAKAESGHLAIVNKLHQAREAAVLPENLLTALPPEEQLIHDVAGSDGPILDHAIAHEESTAAFYTQLAQVTVMPTLKQAFAELAQAETRHVADLQALKTRFHTSV
jgi:rubrerythrin